MSLEEPEPRVAVVIPCFNDGEYVLEALASVREQEPCEIAIVNDGSTERGTLDVLDGLESRGVRVVHQANAGLSAARMAGVRATSARYVIGLDADDKLPQGAITALAGILDSRPEVTAVWGDVESFGKRRCRYHALSWLDPWRITYLCEPVGPSVMVRRDALLSVGGWDMGSGYEDWDLLMKGAGRGWRGVGIPAVALHYREHEESRMFAESRARHSELTSRLRSRHPALYRSRGRSWRASPTGWPLKLTWPIIAALPGISELTREGLYILARDFWEPWMAPDCAGSVRRRIWLQLRNKAGR